MHKVLDLFFGSVMRGGVVLKQLEREIIECPVSNEQVLAEMAEETKYEDEGDRRK